MYENFSGAIDLRDLCMTVVFGKSMTAELKKVENHQKLMDALIL